jgi:hypothetical protein
VDTAEQTGRPAERAGSGAAAATAEGRAGSAPGYSERLYLPWYHWFLPLVAAVLLAAEVHMGYPGVRAWLPYVITIPLTALIIWRFGNAKVEVHDGEIWAGEAHLPLRFVSEIRMVPQETKRKVLGPGFDPAAFALHRSWIGPMVWLKLDDPEDPTPYWLVSTRAPERLIEALTAEINRTEGADAGRNANSTAETGVTPDETKAANATSGTITAEPEPAERETAEPETATATATAETQAASQDDVRDDPAAQTPAQRPDGEQAAGE